jgi:outer membrane protein assembly factor BamE
MGLKLTRWPPIALSVVLSLAAGCASERQDRTGLFVPYRIDLPQGNYVTREMLSQVREGATREQVRAVMGVPLLNSMFHNDRWDYVFRYQRPSGQAELRRVVIRFKDDRVASVEADELPEREDASDPALPGYRPRPVVEGGAPPVVEDNAKEPAK